MRRARMYAGMLSHEHGAGGSRAGPLRWRSHGLQVLGRGAGGLAQRSGALHGESPASATGTCVAYEALARAHAVATGRRTLEGEARGEDAIAEPVARTCDVTL